MKRILIIDDVRDRAAWLKASLELAEFEVVGILAWEQVDESSISSASADVIIVDANAPGRDTLEQISLMSKTLEKPVVVLGAQKDPRSIRIELRISHEELSEMVGTTRPRISWFMQRFHNLGLIETNRDRFLIIKEKKLTDYLTQIA